MCLICKLLEGENWVLLISASPTLGPHPHPMQCLRLSFTQMCPIKVCLITLQPSALPGEALSAITRPGKGFQALIGGSHWPTSRESLLPANCPSSLVSPQRNKIRHETWPCDISPTAENFRLKPQIICGADMFHSLSPKGTSKSVWARTLPWPDYSEIIWRS